MGCEIHHALWYFLEGLACLLCLIYPSRWIQHDVDLNDGLLVLVNQTHQLLCVIRLHQHNRTREGVGFPQLRVVDCVQNKERKYECDIPVISKPVILLPSPQQQHPHHR